MRKHDAMSTSQPLQERLLALIDARLDSPELTPRGAALALGVSVRRLHGLLAGTPHTFSRLVTRRRLQRAHALLAQPHASVIEVAFDCGFNSVATFYRQYVAAFGVSPARRRRHGGASLEAMRVQADPCTH
jgi:AraC-like DNA-binding protein